MLASISLPMGHDGLYGWLLFEHLKILCKKLDVLRSKMWYRRKNAGSIGDFSDRSATALIPQRAYCRASEQSSLAGMRPD